MGASNVKQEDKVQHEQETSMVGTFIGVGFVGVVILVTYIVLYGLYMARV